MVFMIIPSSLYSQVYTFLRDSENHHCIQNVIVIYPNSMMIFNTTPESVGLEMHVINISQKIIFVAKAKRIKNKNICFIYINKSEPLIYYTYLLEINCLSLFEAKIYRIIIF